MLKKTKTTEIVDTNKAVSALGDQPSKADLRRALGKPVDGPPTAGRLGAGG